MTWDLSSKELETVARLPDSQRYQHFVKKVSDWQELWSLHGEDGWVLAGERTGHEVVPVWPHAKYAEMCVAGSWTGSTPNAISLAHWMEKWIPGLIRDNRLIAVFPTLDVKGIVVTPEQLQHDLEAELSRLLEID